MAKNSKGITASKAENYSEWYTQVIQKAQLIEYSPVSGCYILRPNAFYIWEKVKEYFDALIKQDGVENAYFPLFIPENLLTKEASHVEGFAPEVAWVTHGGSSKLGERLAIRPTSETIMYDAYSKWIRSHKDLPLRLNQWCNVVRWEFKHCTPFLRSREFLWQEGHTVFATKQEADDEARKMLDFYAQTFEEMYAIPVLKGQKSELEKFAGADYTLSVETFLPDGKAIQGATSHHLGQNFAKAFDISYMDEHQQSQYCFQNSWGISTRSIGIMILMHSDDKGLVLPPAVAKHQVVIVPILFDATREAVLEAANRVQKDLVAQGIRVHMDARAEYSPGWKFNEWEMKGLPLRVEIGPRDLDAKQVTISRRDNAEKKPVPFQNVAHEASALLKDIHSTLFTKAKEHLESSIVQAETLDDVKAAVKNSKIAFAPWCGTKESEEKLKEMTGAKSLNAPFNQPSLEGKKCFITGEEAKYWFYFGKSL